MQGNVRYVNVIEALIVAQFKGVLLPSIVVVMPYIWVSHSGFFDYLAAVAILPIMIAIFSFVFAFPSFVLGVIVSKRLLDRRVTNTFVWVFVSTVIGVAWWFFMLQFYGFYYPLICGALIGYFMSGYARKVVTESSADNVDLLSKKKVSLGGNEQRYWLIAVAAIITIIVIWSNGDYFY